MYAKCSNISLILRFLYLFVHVSWWFAKDTWFGCLYLECCKCWKECFYSFSQKQTFKHFTSRFCLDFCSFFFFSISLPYLQICNGMYFESQKDPIFLLISRLLTFARRKQFYAYDSDNFTKIENILKYNANI